MSCLDYVALQPTSGVNYGRHAHYRPRDGQNAPFGAASMAMGAAYHNVPNGGYLRFQPRRSAPDNPCCLRGRALQPCTTAKCTVPR